MAKILTILLVALVFEAIGVVLLSRGLKQIAVTKPASALGTPDSSPGTTRWNLAEIFRLVGRGITNKFILLGVAFETVFFVGLLILLAKAEVSVIWPLTSLGFVITTLAAKILEAEQISVLRWSGVILIVVGATIVGWSKKIETPPLPAVAMPRATVE